MDSSLPRRAHPAQKPSTKAHKAGERASKQAQKPGAKVKPKPDDKSRTEPSDKPSDTLGDTSSAKSRTGVASLTLGQFRCFSHLQLDASLIPDLAGGLAACPAVALVGVNGSGKTSVLEALSLLGPGRGLRGAATERLAKQHQEQEPPSGIATGSTAMGGTATSGWFVAAELQLGGGRQKIALGAGGEAGSRKRYLLDDQPVSANRLPSLVPLLWLTPAQVNLFSGGTSGRQKFYDRLVAGFFPDQARILTRATKLRQERRQILAESGGRVSGQTAQWLESLEAGLASETLAADGRRLAVARRLATPLGALAPPFCNLSLTFTGASQQADEAALFAYAQALDEALATSAAQAVPLPAPESAGDLVAQLARSLAEARAQDGLTGRTKISPSQFDFATQLLDPAGTVLGGESASTGEEKRALLSLLLGGTRALVASGFVPLLLLDELVAHLDREVSKALFAALEAAGSQVWVSGQEVSAFPPRHFLRLALTIGAGGKRLIAPVA